MVPADNTRRRCQWSVRNGWGKLFMKVSGMRLWLETQTTVSPGRVLTGTTAQTSLRLTWLDRTWGGQRNVEAVQADITQQWNVNTISMTNCTHLQVQQITTFLLALLFYQPIPFTPLLHLPAPTPSSAFSLSHFWEHLMEYMEKNRNTTRWLGCGPLMGVLVNLWGCSTV